MFKCFGPGQAEREEGVLVDLKRARDAAEAQVVVLRKQLDGSVVAQRGAAVAAQEQREAAVRWQALAERKSHAVVKLLHDIQQLVSAFEAHSWLSAAPVGDVDSQPDSKRGSKGGGLNAPDMPDTPNLISVPLPAERNISSHIIDTVQQPDTDGGALPQEPAAQLQVDLVQGDVDALAPPSPEHHLRAAFRKLQNLHHMANKAFLAESARHCHERQRADTAEACLADAHAARETAEAQHRTQLEAFELERMAVKSGSETLSELNQELTAQLEEAQRALAAAAGARTAARESEARALSDAATACKRADASAEEAETARAALEAALKDLAQATEELTALRRDASEDKKELSALRLRAAEDSTEIAELRRQLNDALATLSASQEEAATGLARVAELQGQLSGSQQEVARLSTALRQTTESLQACVNQEKAASTALAAAKAKLASTEEQVSELRARLQSTDAELSASQAASAAATASMLATKRELVVVRQQLADTARSHGTALTTLGGSDVALTAANAELQEVKAELATATAQVEALKQQAASRDQVLESLNHQVEATRTQLSATAGALVGAHAAAEAVAAMAEAPLVYQAAGGLAALLTDEERATYREVLEATPTLHLQLADVPLGMIASIAADPTMRSRLREITVSLDTAAEAPSMEVALRATSLASGLAHHTELTRVTVSAETWSGSLGDGPGLAGLAGPFVALAARLQARTGMAPPPPGPRAAHPRALTLPHSTASEPMRMQIDTHLVGPACARLLLQLMHEGLVHLAAAPGQAGLMLVSGHEDLDAWYHEMLSKACHSAVPSPMTTAAITSRLNSAGGATTIAAGSTRPGHAARPSSAQSVTDTPGLTLVPGLTPPDTWTPYAVPGSIAAHSSWGAGSDTGQSIAPYIPALTPESSRRQLASHVPSPSGATPGFDVELINMGLVSHHMALVMVVLATCPVHRLKLDGNKVGDAGAQMLALALPEAHGLRDLALPRNALTKQGLASLASGLARCMALRSLNCAEQRGCRARASEPPRPGRDMGPMMAEASAAGDVVAAMLRAGGLPALHDLNMEGLGLGEQGASAFASLLGTNHPLRRLAVSGRGPPPMVAKRLADAAAARPGFVLSAVWDDAQPKKLMTPPRR